MAMHLSGLIGLQLARSAIDSFVVGVAIRIQSRSSAETDKRKNSHRNERGKRELWADDLR